MTVALRCPVRGCGRPLTRADARWTCPQAHSFDVSRSGALNLLQPQDRRSAHPGDSKDAAQARRRLAGLGHATAVHGALRHAIAGRPRPTGRPLTVLDVGCGEGVFLRSLARLEALDLHGVDISAPSVDLAARAQPGAHFVVANADRSLPWADRSFDVIVSIDARVNAAEFARLLAPGGLLLVAVPAPDDLIELRARVQGRGLQKSRVERVEQELAGGFSLLERATVKEARWFEPSALRDLLVATYRGFRAGEREAAEVLEPMTVTLAHDVLAFTPRRVAKD